jgi:hypothetical protein
MEITNFISKLKQAPRTVSFAETIAVIEDNYSFSPTAFENGTHHNAAGENSGSCKIFAFAELNNLSAAETLNCFGAYYHEEVLANPEGTNHQNIRNFMKTGWDGIAFYGEALELKKTI